MVRDPRRRCCQGRCQELGIAEFNGARFCGAHAPARATSLRTTPCSVCGLVDFLTAGKCAACDPTSVTRIRHAKEERVAQALTDAGIAVVARDMALEGSECVMARPDFQVLGEGGAWWVYVECDEHQHDHIPRECEVARMRNLAEVRGQPVVFVRFNPDEYTPRAPPAGGAVAPARRWTQPQRHAHLVRCVREAMQQGPQPGDVVSALWLFFDDFCSATPTWSSVVRAHHPVDASGTGT